MRLLFVKDDTGTIWLNYVNQLKVRENKMAQMALQNDLEEMRLEKE